MPERIRPHETQTHVAGLFGQLGAFQLPRLLSLIHISKERTTGACPLVAGGPDVGNWDPDDEVTQEEENRAVTASVSACINACDGYFLFDMIHLKKADQWSYVKAGIDALSDK